VKERGVPNAHFGWVVFPMKTVEFDGFRECSSLFRIEMIASVELIRDSGLCFCALLRIVGQEKTKDFDDSNDLFFRRSVIFSVARLTTMTLPTSTII
jgi:hypothetical protein